MVAGLIILSPLVRRGPVLGHDFDVGGSVGESAAFESGELIWLGTNTLNMTSDVTASLVRLEPLGLPSAIPYETLYMPIAGTQGALGAFSDTAVPAANRRNAQPLAGVTVTRKDAFFQLLITITMPVGEVTIHGYVLTYAVRGETREVYIARSQHLCIGTERGPGCNSVEPYQ